MTDTKLNRSSRVARSISDTLAFHDIDEVFWIAADGSVTDSVVEPTAPLRRPLTIAQDDLLGRAEEQLTPREFRGWVAYAPLVDAGCAPVLVRVKFGSVDATETFVGGVSSPNGPHTACVGTLMFSIGQRHFNATAIGPRFEVRSFVAAIEPVAPRR